MSTFNRKRQIMEHEPAYTQPPKRKWVGLTDDEFEKLSEESWIYPRKLLQAIEAKLKEKKT